MVPSGNRGWMARGSNNKYWHTRDTASAHNRAGSGVFFCFYSKAKWADESARYQITRWLLLWWWLVCSYASVT